MSGLRRRAHPGRFIPSPLILLLILAASLGVGSGFAPSTSSSAMSVTPFHSSRSLAVPHAHRLLGSLVHPPWRTVFGINPMAGVVEGFRWALLGKSHTPGPLLWVSVAAVVVLLIGGLRYFKKTESTFADIV